MYRFGSEHDSAIDRVIEGDFVQEFLSTEDVDVTADELRADLRERRRVVEQDLLSEVKRVDLAEEVRSNGESAIESAMNSRPAARFVGVSLFTAALDLIAFGVIFFVNKPFAMRVLSSWRTPLAHVAEGWSGLLITLMWIILYVTIISILVFAIETLLREKPQRAKLAERFKVAEAKEVERQALEHFRKVIDGRVLKDVVAIVNQTSGPIRHATKIFVSDRVGLTRRTMGVGLTEVVDREKIASTDIEREVERLIAEQTGGSIGISGPRGVGKSTLLTRICDGRLAVGRRKALAIISAAPVEYDGRAFLLHLFSSLCLKTLSTETGDYLREAPSWRRVDLWSPYASQDQTFTVEELAGEPLKTWRDDQAVQHAKPFGRLLLGMGVVFGLLSLVIASAQYEAAVAARTKLAPATGGQMEMKGVTTADGTGKAAVAKTATDAKAKRGAEGAAAQSNPALNTAVSTPSPAPQGVFQVLNIQAGPLALFSLAALALGAALFLNIYFAWIWEGITRRTGWTLSVKQRLIQSNGLVRHSLDQLRNIRFQRSFTSGWSGAVKVPVGFELNATAGVSYAQNPESLPELVERFRLYVSELVGHYGCVVIAIDELDKLKSTKEAEAFLNSIKSVFNIPGCFFLISVSEHALASFERRGVGFRDAFDSALDMVLQLDYCGLKESRALLTPRIVHWPEPFLYVNHMLSGGLPRDLIRGARDMLAIAAVDGAHGASLKRVTEEIIRREALSKIRATSITLRLVDDNHDANDILVRVAKLSEFTTIKQLTDRAGKFRAALEAEIKGVAEPGRSKLLCLELAVFLGMLSQVHRVAALSQTPSGWSRIARYKVCDKVTEVRQALEVSMPLAAARLDVAERAIAQAEGTRATRAKPTAGVRSTAKVGDKPASARAARSIK